MKSIGSVEISQLQDMKMDKIRFSAADLPDGSDEVACWQAQTPQA